MAETIEKNNRSADMHLQSLMVETTESIPELLQNQNEKSAGSDTDELENFIRNIEVHHRLTANEKSNSGCLSNEFVKPASSLSAFSWKEKILAKESVGIEISDRSIRIVKILNHKNKTALLNALEQNIPKGQKPDELLWSRYLQDMLHRFKCNGSDIISVLNGPDVHLRLLKMPKVTRKEIHDALLWKNKKELHFFNDAPTVLHYVILDDATTDHTMEFFVLVIAVKEDLIKKNLAILDKAGIVPSKLIIKPVAQWNIIKMLGDIQSQIILLDLGHHSSHISFFNHGQLQYSRDIPTGGYHFTQALTETIFYDNRSLMLSWDEAEDLKHKIGLVQSLDDDNFIDGVPASEFAVMMRPAAERLISEIKMSLDYYKNNFKQTQFKRLFITGNASRLSGLNAYIQGHIHVPAIPLNLDEFIRSQISSQEHDNDLTSFIDATGAALSKDAQFNFLPDQLQSEARFSRYASRLLKGFSVVVLSMAVTTFLLLYQLWQVKNLQQRCVEALQGVQSESVEFDRLVKAQDEALSQIRILESELNRDSCVLNAMKIVSKIVPETVVLTELVLGEGYNDIELNRIKVTKKMEMTPSDSLKSKRSLYLKGLVYKDVFYADIHLMDMIGGLHKTNYFNDIILKEKRRNEVDEKLYFEIQAIL